MAVNQSTECKTILKAANDRDSKTHAGRGYWLDEASKKDWLKVPSKWETQPDLYYYPQVLQYYYLFTQDIVNFQAMQDLPD